MNGGGDGLCLIRGDQNLQTDKSSQDGNPGLKPGSWKGSLPRWSDSNVQEKGASSVCLSLSPFLPSPLTQGRSREWQVVAALVPPLPGQATRGSLFEIASVVVSNLIVRHIKRNYQQLLLTLLGNMVFEDRQTDRSTHHFPQICLDRGQWRNQWASGGHSLRTQRRR